ncbi:ribonuclease P protein component [Kineobactrum sediminis]|uniref:Ribonuclease P protein component n=1 Tax=Kineobactrum sediminis TaxID=1905677 RepID=A0A2N5Y4X0_9GAMM|nr:ribonuclease P protein component [Kineobactrum sediminis]PLW83440.1 ribonuclease P protein component [Kineobactrum sediminis]
MSSADSPAPQSEAFGKSRRLLTAADYRPVFNGADSKASNRYLLLLGRWNNQPGPRLGLVIAKKNVRKAVQRNRIKRIAREMFRKLPEDAPALDVVLMVRRGIDQLDNAQIFAILSEQWLKLQRVAVQPAPVRES